MPSKKEQFKKYQRKGILITPRDLKLLKELSYGWTPPEQLYSLWNKEPEFMVGGEKTKPLSSDKGGYNSFKNRLNDLIKYNYIKREYIPIIGPIFNKGSRSVLGLSGKGEEELNILGVSHIIRNHPFKHDDIRHEIMMKTYYKRLIEDMEKCRQEFDIPEHNIKDEYTLRQEIKAKKNSVLPDLLLLMKFKGISPVTRDVDIYVKVIYVEIDAGTISLKRYCEKIAGLSVKPIIKFEEKFDSNFVLVVSNTSERCKGITSLIRYNKNSIMNYRNIGVCTSNDVCRHGFFAPIFKNCDNEGVDVVPMD